MNPVRIALAIVLTAAFTAACYVIWSEMAALIRGTFWNEFRFATSVVAIFAFLTVLEKLMDLVAKYLPQSEH